MKLRDSGYDPNSIKGREVVTTAAVIEARRIFMQDWAIKEIIKDNEAMEAVAGCEFDKWCMEEHFLEFLEDDPQSDDFQLLRRTYIAGFRREYKEHIQWVTTQGVNTDEWDTRSLPTKSEGAQLRIVKTTSRDDSRVYEIELKDPDYSGDPIRFEVELKGQGDPELREVDTHD
jgi:hypothetical protein